MLNELDSVNFERKFIECDNKFQTIFNLTSTASKVISPDLTIIKVNDALIKLLGYSADEIEGTKILEYACEEYQAHWLHLQHELWSRNVPFFKLEACLYHKNGSIVWVDVTTILYKDEGETYGFTVLDDITGLKNFQESERRLTRALKYSKTAVWELNIEDQTVFRSESHDEIFGYEQRQSVWNLSSYAAHISEEDLPKFNQGIDSALKGNNIDLQLRLATSDGSIKWVNFQGIPEKNRKGKAYKVLGVIKDITTDKLLERHKDDFISIASHELKTPVTSLKAYLQVLDKKKEVLPQPMQSMIVKANQSVGKVVQLIDELLNASKSYQQQLELKLTEFNLYKIAKESVEQVSMSLGLPVIAISGANDIEVNADAERISRVIINLLNNAVKYASGSKKITVHIERHATNAQLSVADEGPGIEKEKIPLLFDRYYQATVLNHQYSGLGLGLFISAEIIRKHGGQIWVENKPSGGAIVYFSIPLSK